MGEMGGKSRKCTIWEEQEGSAKYHPMSLIVVTLNYCVVCTTNI